MQAFDKALKLQSDKETLFAHTLLLARAGQFEKARKYALLGVAKDRVKQKRDPQVWKILYDIHMQLGDVEAMRAHFKDAKRMGVNW